MTLCLFLLSILLPLIAMFLIFYKVYPVICESPQVFHDIIIEHVSVRGFNKSGELSFFWLCTVTCIILTLVLTCLFSKYKKTSKNLSGLSTNMLTVFSVCAIPFIGHLVIFKRISVACGIAILIFIAAGIYCKTKKKSPLPLLFLGIVSYYAVLSVLTVFMHFSTVFIISQSKIYLISGAVSLLLILCGRIFSISYKHLLLLLQISIPFLLSLYFVDRYMYQGTLQKIPYAPFYYIFFGALLLIFLILTVFHTKNNWKNAASLALGKIIHPVTAITVFIYNSYSACPMYAQPDQHHHGEQMIPWQQIVTLGQSAYEEYTPVSGLFPMVNGFIQNVLLGGTVSDYSPSISIMMVLFCIVTMYLIYRHVGGAYALGFAIFFALPSYNRQYMVLPILLLLFLKELLNRPGTWLKAWIFSCFLAGLYYPLYGGAVLVGTTPLGIYMLFRYAKETDWKSERKNWKFYAGWLICMFPIAISLPLLVRMAGHTLVYSGQTVLADGISLYALAVPEIFMPYLIGTHDTIRGWLYYGYRFFLPIFPPVLSAALGTWVALKCKKENQTTKHLFLFGILATIFTLAISYTYTLVRADEGAILSRTAPILVAVGGMFLATLLLSYGKKIITPSIRIISLGICFAVPMLIYHQVSAMKAPDMWIYPNGNSSLVMDDANKLFTYYDVPDIFISMQEIELSDTSMLGNGFMVADQLHYLTEYDSVMQKCESVNPDISYLGLDGQGFYYYLNAKSCATGFAPVGKSYEAQKRMLETISAQRPVVFLINPKQIYFIYYWMVTSDYVYSAEDGAFFPIELYQKIYPDRNTGDDYRLYTEQAHLNKSPASFGKSYESILPLTDGTTLTQDEMSGPLSIRGTDYDLLLVKIDDELLAKSEILKIVFLSDGNAYFGSSITCFTTNDTLLIPLGMNENWLLGENSEIVLSLYDNSTNCVAQTLLEQASDIGLECTLYKLKH